MMAEVENKEKMKKFFAKQIKLLKLEQLEASKRQNDELGKYVEAEVDEIIPQPHGGFLLKLEGETIENEPSFKAGEKVSVGAYIGILKKVILNTYEIEVSVDSEVFQYKRRWRIMKLSDDTSFKIMEEALVRMSSKPSSHLMDVLLGLRTPTKADPLSNQALSYHNTKLDKSQKKGVEFALSQKELAVIHGPPGTGKTTTLVEIVYQAVKRGEKVLVTAASHVAVDNIAEKLVEAGLNIIRIGKPARITSSVVLNHSVDDRLAKLGGNIQREQVILSADVVLGTLIGCGSSLRFLDQFSSCHFQLTIIDECGQSLEMACWVVIPRSPRLILAGDHNQLPPTVLTQSKEAAYELSRSLMERVLDMFFYGFGAHMLQIQYRMNKLIMDWSSTNFYHGKLYAAPKVSDHKLADLPLVTTSPITNSVLRMIDTAGKGLRETSSPSRSASSLANLGEAAIVIDYIEILIKHGVKPEQIAIVSPYKAQVNVLEANLLRKYPKLEIRSVDGFQGREKEVVILTMVRSNGRKNLGFLVEKRRLNVGVTRARRQLVLICDSSTVGEDEFLGRFISYMRYNGSVIEAPVLDTGNIVVPWRESSINNISSKMSGLSL